MRRRLKPSEINHLHRLIGWIRCEIGPSPEEHIEIVKFVHGKIPDIDPAGQQRLVESHRKYESVPKYVRAAIKALEKTLQERDFDVVDGESEEPVMIEEVKRIGSL